MDSKKKNSADGATASLWGIRTEGEAEHDEVTVKQCVAFADVPALAPETPAARCPSLSRRQPCWLLLIGAGCLLGDWCWLAALVRVGWLAGGAGRLAGSCWLAGCLPGWAWLPGWLAG